MSDQKLRDLERRWKETGSPDDEAAYLLERVRVGDLTRERLELAALLGAPGAMIATGLSLPDFDSDRKGPESNWIILSDWLRRIYDLEPLLGVRAALLAARQVYCAWEEVHPEVLEPGAALDLAEQWCSAPSAETASRAVEAGLRADLEICEATLYEGPRPETFAGFAAAYAAMAVAAPGTELHTDGGPVTSPKEAVAWSGSAAADALGGPGPLVRHVASELIPLALSSGE